MSRYRILRSMLVSMMKKFWELLWSFLMVGTEREGPGGIWLDDPSIWSKYNCNTLWRPVGRIDEIWTILLRLFISWDQQEFETRFKKYYGGSGEVISQCQGSAREWRQVGGDSLVQLMRSSRKSMNSQPLESNILLSRHGVTCWRVWTKDSTSFAVN